MIENTKAKMKTNRIENLGHLEVTKYLIEIGADINATDNSGMVALHYSSMEGKWKSWYSEQNAQMN